MLTEKANRAMHCERQNDFGSKVVRGSNMAHGLPPTSAQGQLLQRPPTRQPASAGEGNQGSETTTLRKAMDAVSFPILLARLPNSISPPSPHLQLTTLEAIQWIRPPSVWAGYIRCPCSWNTKHYRVTPS